MYLEEKAVEQVETLLKSAAAQMNRAAEIAMESDDHTIADVSLDIAKDIKMLNCILRRGDHQSATFEYSLYYGDEEGGDQDFTKEEGYQEKPDCDGCGCSCNGNAVKGVAVRVVSNPEAVVALSEFLNDYVSKYIKGGDKSGGTEDK